MSKISIYPVKAILFVALIVALAVPAAASELWLHVRVEEDNGAKVKINVPLAFVETILESSMIDGLDMDDIVIDDVDLSVSELRSIWNELQNSPDMTFVTVEDHDETVEVAKKGGYLLVQIQEDHHDSSVDVKIPAPVVDALLSGEGDELNIAAALQALAHHGDGELVTVNDRDDFVRVWIDDIPEAD